MGDTDIRIDIVGDASKWARGVIKATNSLLDLAKAEAAINVATETVTRTWERFVASQIEATRQMDRLSRSSGLSTRTVAGLSLVAKELKQDLDTVVPVDFADKLQELREGSKTWVDDFKLLGLTQADFEAVNYDVTKSFELMVRAMSTTTDRTKALGAASRLMSTSGEHLIAVFGDGSRTLDDFAKAAEEFGSGSEGAAAASRELADALADVTLATDEASSSLVRVLDELGVDAGLTYFARGAAYALGTLEGSLGRLKDRLTGTNVLLNLTTFGLYGVVDAVENGWGTALEEGRERLDSFDRATRDTFRMIPEAVAATVDILDQIPESLKATGDEAKALAKIAEDNAEKAKKLAEERRRDLEDLQRAEDDWRAKNAAATADHWAALRDQQEARAMLEAEAVAERIEAIQEAERARQAAADAELASLLEATAARRKAAEDAIRQAEAIRDAQREAQGSIADNAAGAASALVGLLEQSSGRHRALLTAAVAAQKAAAIVQALLNVGPAFNQGLAAAPPPFGAILGGINAGLALGQVAVTQAVNVPRFHTGTAPDERPAILHRTEAVLTAEAIQALNAGRGPGGSGGEVVVAIGHQVIDRAATTAAGIPGSGLHKAITRGDLPGRTRRRRP